MLFARDADHKVREPVTNNNILHLTAKHITNLELAEYVFKNAKVDVFERNASGHSPLNIARDGANKEVA